MPVKHNNFPAKYFTHMSLTIPLKNKLETCSEAHLQSKFKSHSESQYSPKPSQLCLSQAIVDFSTKWVYLLVEQPLGEGEPEGVFGVILLMKNNQPHLCTAQFIVSTTLRREDICEVTLAKAHLLTKKNYRCLQQKGDWENTKSM